MGPSASGQAVYSQGNLPRENYALRPDVLNEEGTIQYSGSPSASMQRDPEYGTYVCSRLPWKSGAQSPIGGHAACEEDALLQEAAIDVAFGQL